MTLRQEIQTFIDDIPESKLIALKPLLVALLDDSIVIENNLTDDEKLIVDSGMKEYKSDPSKFISIDEIK